MAGHSKLGEIGENEALIYLMKSGYTLHEKNWRNGHLEIDIIAEWWGEIVFVEVKTRSDENFAPAADAVTLQKKRNIIEAARIYLARHNWSFRPYRFDIITVVGREKPFKITHFKDTYAEKNVREETHHFKTNDFSK